MPAEPTPSRAPVVETPPAAAERSGADSGQDAGASSAAGAGAGEGRGQGGGVGNGAGTGAGAGVGSGSGPGTGVGNGGKGAPPEPRQLVLPPSDYPNELRGRAVDVTFWVNGQGGVDRVEVAPAIQNGGFAKKFKETMRNYRFRPARSPEGLPVPGTITVNVAFF